MIYGLTKLFFSFKNTVLGIFCWLPLIICLAQKKLLIIDSEPSEDYSYVLPVEFLGNKMNMKPTASTLPPGAVSPLAAKKNSTATTLPPGAAFPSALTLTSSKSHRGDNYVFSAYTVDGNDM